MKQLLLLVVAWTSVTIAVEDSAWAGVLYMRSNVEKPWGVSTNEQAMDAVFGAGQWQDLRYETVNPFTAFSSSNSFAFLEGSDSNANELETFLNSNLSTIEAWVAAGGNLFLNAAPNEGDGMSFGFGGVNLVYQPFSDNPVEAVDPSHPIFNGPFATSVSFTGNAFAHASLEGPSLAPLLRDPNGKVHLAELNHGLGSVLFGGMTTTNFHSPDPAAFNLRANILDYTAAQTNHTVAAPEPASLAIFGLGACVLSLGAARRQRHGKQLRTA